MKSTKRFIAVVIALALVMSFGATVFADTTDETGSITIRNTTKDETYKIYKIFDLTYVDVPEVGTEGQEGYVPAKTNVSYTYTTADADNDALYAALTATGSPFTLTASTTAGVYNVELTSGKTATDVATFFNGLDKEVLPTATATAAGTGADLKFENLAYGYYYIESSLGATVTVDSTLKDVKVIDKNEGPSWDNDDTPNPEYDPEDPNSNPTLPNTGKVIIMDTPQCGKDHTHTDACYKVKSNEVNFGDTVKFSIAIDATAYDKEALITYYYITDTLDPGFSKPTNLKVTVGGTEISESDYTISWSEDEHSFKINLPFGEKYGSNAKIEVTYEATVLDTAVVGAEGNTNTADFAYATDPAFDPDKPAYPPTPEIPNPDDDPNNPDDDFIPNEDYPTDPGKQPEYDDDDNPDTPDVPKPYDPEKPYIPGTPDDEGETIPGVKEEPVETKTYTYAIGIKKVAEKLGGAPLAGATFSLKMVKDAKGTTLTTPVEIKATATTTTGVYNYDANGSATVFATDNNGQLVIKGLVPGTYEITEVDHPAGYNPLTAPETAVIEIGADDVEGSILSINEAVVSEIVNKSGVELPATGGFGTTLLIGLGSVLFIATALLLVTKKRMYNAG